MPNGERISDRRFREWEQALAPYVNNVEEFAREKGLRIVKWRMNYPSWLIGRSQQIDDLDKIWWNIQLGYSEREKKLGLNASAWIDTEYEVPDGRVHERRLSDSPEKHLIATWQKGDQVNIKELLEIAYERATSYTQQDLTRISASITGKDGITTHYK